MANAAIIATPVTIFADLIYRTVRMASEQSERDVQTVIRIMRQVEGSTQMIEVEHKDGYCIASRKTELCKVNVAVPYELHGNDPQAAEAVARAKVELAHNMSQR